MLKFLRKYQTIVLAVGVSLLMIAFLLNDVMLQISHIFGGRTTGTLLVNGKEQTIDNDEFMAAADDVRILNKMGEAFAEFFPKQSTSIIDRLIDPRPLSADDPARVKFGGPWHWALLKREAENAGVMGGVLDANVFRTEFAGMYAMGGITPDEALARVDQKLQVLAGASNASMTQVENALASYIGVRRHIEMYQQAGLISDRRLQHLVDDFIRSLRVRAVFLDAGNMLETAPEPAADAIQSQYEQFRDTEPGTGQFGFGYRQPDRVKFEYLKIDFQSILDATEVTGIEARKWYLENVDDPQVIRRVGNPPAPQTYEVVSADIIRKLKLERALARSAEISKFVKGELMPQLQGLERDGDYRIVGPDWTANSISLELLRDRVQTEFGVDAIFRAHQDKWVPIASLSDPAVVGDIARAVRDFGSQSVPFGQLVDSVRELGHPRPGSTLQVGLVDAEPAGLKTTVYFFGRPVPHVTDLFFYRVTAADAARPAASLDEVRDQVVRDLQRLEIYQKMRQSIDEWRARAAADGLESLARATGNAKPLEQEISRIDDRAAQMGQGLVASEISGIGRYEHLADEIFHLARTFDPRNPLDTLPIGDRIVVTPIENRLGLAVVEIVSHRPMSQERWQRLAGDPSLLGTFTREELDAQIASPFEFAHMCRKYELRTEGPFAISDEEMTGQPQDDDANSKSPVDS